MDAQDNVEGLLKLGIILLEEDDFPIVALFFWTAIKGQSLPRSVARTTMGHYQGRDSVPTRLSGGA